MSSAEPELLKKSRERFSDEKIEVQGVQVRRRSSRYRPPKPGSAAAKQQKLIRKTHSSDRTPAQKEQDQLDEQKSEKLCEDIRDCKNPQLLWMQTVLLKNVNSQMRRFRLLPICTESPSAECLTTTSDKNAEKNRYADVPCLESSRVVLRGHVTDYYHANYVALQNGKYFICAQAPLKFTAEDFWHMVIQEQCRFIVMLCSFMEEEKEKSSEYFPRCAEKAMIGKFLISVLKRSTRPHGITETLLNVKHRSGSAEVRHLQLTTWPDHSAPLEVDGVLDLYKEVLKYQKSNDNPVLVHCSAGVGRTCTFVGGLLLMERVFQRDNPSALSVVKEIRKYRYAAVRRATQLLFMQYSVMEMFVKDGVMDEDEPQLCVYRAKFLKLVRKINSNKKKGKEMTSEMQQSNDK